MSALDYAELARACCGIARTAGRAIMEIYAGPFAVERKDDNSPLTAADLAAHRAIVAGLNVITPQIPVLSEESSEQIAWNVRSTWHRYWLVDPLDGTREFVKRNGEFTVNIALIEDGVAVIGVVFAPVPDEMFFAWKGGNALQSRAGVADDSPLRTRRREMQVVVAGSRSHGDERLHAALKKIGAHRLIALGSSLKFCRTAQGAADIYIRYGLTSEWDTAAGQCVLEQAGGAVVTSDGKPLRYNGKDSLLNPDFIAYGDPSVDWAALIADGASA